MDVRQQIGDNLRYARIRKRMKQAELVKAMGIGAVTLSSWETGKTLPGLENLLLLMSILDITMDDVLEGVNYGKK